MPFLQPLRNTAGVTRGRGEDEAVRGLHEHGTVIEDDSRLAEHQPISGFPGSEVGEVIDVEAIQELVRIGSVDLDLAER